MRTWEKNKKGGPRRTAELESNHQFQDHKKKKLKPAEKSKYRLKGAVEDEE